MRTKTLTSALAGTLLLACSCSSGNGNTITAEGFAARSQGDARWGVVDAKGRYIVENAYDNPPSAVTDGMYTVQDNDGQYVLYDASSAATAVSASPLEQVTSFFKGVAFATRRGTSIFIIDHSCKPLTVLPDTVWEVRLTGDRRTVFAYRDQNDRWGILNADGTIAEPAGYDTYEAFCVGHHDLFIEHPHADASLQHKFNNVITINPLSPPHERVYAASDGNGVWKMVNGVGETIGQTRWREYAFSLCHGSELVAQESDGAYRLLHTDDGRAGQIGKLAFNAVSCKTYTSVKSGRMYPIDGCTKLCDFLMTIDLNHPDSVTQVIPAGSDAAFYHLTSVTFPDIMADVDIAKSTLDKTRRLMAVVKITLQGRYGSESDSDRTLRNLMVGIEQDIEQRHGWERIGGESHALKYGNERFIYIIPYSGYIVAVVSADRLDYSRLMGPALKISKQI